MIDKWNTLSQNNKIALIVVILTTLFSVLGYLRLEPSSSTTVPISQINQETSGDNRPALSDTNGDVIIEYVTPSRKFTGPSQFPPENFLAYGILAFPQRATKDSKQRHLMICDAYVSALPHTTELSGVPLSEQIVTVWPIENDELATRIDKDTPRNKVCEIAVDHYGLVVAKSALNDAAKAEAVEKELIRGDTLNFKNLKQGPYLLAWAPGNKKGDSDALVLVLDLTRVNLPQHAKAIFIRWVQEIERDPSVWSNGWDIPAVRLKLRLWADDLGGSVVGWIDVVQIE